MPTSTPKKLLGRRDVRARYGNVVGRTLSRWLEKRALPQPDQIINGQQYWWESTLEQHERARVAEKATTPSTNTATAS
jgi:hypothetical protein